MDRMRQPQLYRNLHFVAAFLSDPSTTANLINGVLGSYLGAGAIGALIQGSYSARFGRRFTTGTSAVLVIISGALMAGSVHIGMFIAGRLVGGIASGMLVTNIPVYTSEIAPAHSRGLLTGIPAAGFTFAYVISSALGLGFTFVDGSMQWRATFVVLTGLAFLLLGSTYFVPESPRWLVEKERYDEAWKIFERIHQHPRDPENKIAKAELVQVRAQVSAERLLQKGWVYIFKTPHMRRRAFLTFWTWFLGQSTGNFVIANLLPRYFAGLGYPVILQLGLSLAYVSTGLLGSISNALLIDVYGRRRMIVTGGAVATVGMTIVAVLQCFYVDSDNADGLRAAVAMTFVYEFWYCFFLETVTYNYSAELWPTHLRSYGGAISGCTFYLLQVAYSVPSATAFQNIGWRYFLVFIAMSVVSTTVAYFTFVVCQNLPWNYAANCIGN